METLDVALIHPPSCLYDSTRFHILPFTVIPIGLHTLASSLDSSGFNVKIFNLGLDNLMPLFNIEKRIKTINAKIFAVDLQWCVHSDGALKIARMCKRHHPNSMIVLGGITATWFSNDIIKNNKFIDAILLGESDESIVSVARANASIQKLDEVSGILYREGRSIKRNTIGMLPKTLDHINLKLDLIDDWSRSLRTRAEGYDPHAVPAFWIPIARGCIYDCIHCGGGKTAYRLVSGREKLVYRSPEKVVNDIKILYEKGVECICPTHDLQILGKKYWSKLFKGIRELGYDLSCYMEIFQLPEEDFINDVLRTFSNKRAFAISPESPIETVRFHCGKIFSNTQLWKTIKKIDDTIDIHLYFISGLPGETEEVIPVFKKFLEKVATDTNNTFVIPPAPYIIDPNCLMAVSPGVYGVTLFMRNFRDYQELCKGARNIKSLWAKMIGHETESLSRDMILDLVLKMNALAIKSLQVKMKNRSSVSNI